LPDLQVYRQCWLQRLSLAVLSGVDHWSSVTTVTSAPCKLWCTLSTASHFSWQSAAQLAAFSAVGRYILLQTRRGVAAKAVWAESPKPLVNLED